MIPAGLGAATPANRAVLCHTEFAELVVLPQDPSLYKGLWPQDDTVLKEELVRAFLNYLGVSSKRE